MCSAFLLWFFTSICDSGLTTHGVVQFLQLGRGFDVSEMSPQPGASYGSSRQFYFDGIRDVSKALFQLWLFADAMFHNGSRLNLGLI